jgi:hypothetical protein
MTTGPPEDNVQTAARDWGIAPIDWEAFWASEAPEQEWGLEPLVPSGRCTAIYAPAKLGKSLLALDAIAARATGRPVLGAAALDPINCMYLDLEMTEADLRERLTDLGYGPDDDLSRLHYFQLPTLPPLDTELGGEMITGLATELGVSLVAIDTMARAVSGNENDADTYRDFYRFTGRQLKAAGIGVLRLDHQGKDAALGQRGSSAKADDLDVVFRMSAIDLRTMKLTRTHSRIPWGPSEITIVRHEEPLLRHVITGDAFPAGTHDCVLALDELDVPLDASSAKATETLRRAGKGTRKLVVLAALKARRSRP